MLGRCLAENHHFHIDGEYAVKRDPMRESHPDDAFIEPSKEIRPRIEKPRASFTSQRAS